MIQADIDMPQVNNMHVLHLKFQVHGQFQYENTIYAILTSSRDPFTVREATSSQKKDKWMGLMVEKMSLKKNATCELVQLPKWKREINYK